MRVRVSTHDIPKPIVLRIVLELLVPRMAKHHLDLVFLLLRCPARRIYRIARRLRLLLVKLLEICDVVDVVGDLGPAARDADLVARDARLLLLLGARAVVGIRV